MELAEEISIMFIPDRHEDIIHRYMDNVFRIAFTYCRNTADAEDIAQEVFVRYMTKAPAFIGEEHLKAWLIRVTINLSKSHLTSFRVKKIVSISEQHDHGVEDKTNLDTYHAVMSLSEKYRTVVLLYYFEDYSVKEVAKILGKSETAIQTRLQRARSMLKDKLKEDWQND